MMLASIAGISDAQQRKLSSISKLVEEKKQLQANIEELTRKLTDSQLSSISAESSSANIQQTTFELRERFAREVANSNRLKETKRIVEEE